MAEQTSVKMNNKSKGIPVSKIPTSGRDSGTHSRSSSVSNLTTASDMHSEAGDVSEIPDFKIDERVWVNGTKPGYIKFVGKTQFAPGVWTGVLLDEPVGKNDGSVGGVKYFSCEPQRGIFARPQKLTRSPGTVTGIGDSSLGAATPKSGVLSPSSKTVTPSVPFSASKGICSRLRLGERVVVSSSTGVKTGILRFIGETDFAKGDWAGIELDEPVGKNDGSVAGKRYFSCQMKYGLFSPMHKVSRAGGTSVSRASSVRGGSLVRSGSKDSLSSSVSNASRSSRVKLGVTSLTSSQKQRGIGSSVMTNSSALEEALKEKEQHIEELLKERDLDRAEVAKVASHFEEIEAKYSEQKKQQQKSDQDRKLLEDQLAGIKRKLEDFQFQLEEEKIAKSDIEIQLQQRNMLLKRLEEFITSDNDIFVNIKEILEGKENLSVISNKKEIGEDTEKLNGKIVEFENQIKVLTEDNSKVNKELNELQEFLKASEEKNKSLAFSLNNTIQEKDDLISNLKSELNSQIERVTNLMEDNKSLNEQVILQAEQAKGQADDVIKELGEKINALTEEGKTKSCLLEEKARSIQERDNIIASLQKSVESNAALLVQLDTESKTLKQLLVQKDHELEKNIAMQKSLQEEMASLKSKSESEKEEKILELFKEIECLSNNLHEKEEELQTKNDELVSLHANTIEMKKTVEEMKQKLHQAEETFSLASKDNVEKMSECQKLMNELKQEKEHIKHEYEKKLEQEEEQLKIQIADLEAKKSIISEQESQLSLLNQKLTEKDVEYAELNAKLNDFQQEHQKLTEEKESSLNLLSEKEKFIFDLRKETEDFKNMLDCSKLKIEEEGKEILSLQYIMKQKEEEHAQLYAKLQLAEQKVEMLNKDSSEHVMALQKELSKLKEESISTKTNLEQEIIKLQEENEKRSSTIIEESQKLKKKEEILTLLENQVKEKESELLTVTNQVKDLKREISEIIENSEKEKITYQHKLVAAKEGYVNEMKKKEQLFDEKCAELAECTKLLENKDKKLNQKEDDICKLKNLVKEKESQFDELSQMISASQSQLKQLTEQNENNVALLKSKESYINEFKAEQERKFQEKGQLLTEEIAKLQSNLKNKEKDIERNEKLISDLSVLEKDQKKQIETQKTELENMKAEKEKASQESSNIFKEFSTKIADMEQKYSQLLAEKEKIAKEELKIRDAKNSLEQVCNSLRQEKISQEEIVKDKDSKLEALQAKVNHMQAEFVQHKQELQQKLDISKTEVQATLELKKELELQHSVLEELQQELQNSEDKCKLMELEVAKIPSIISEKDQMQNKVNEIEKICKEKSQRIIELEQKSQAVEEQLSNSKNILLQKESELTNLNEKFQVLQTEELAHEKLKVSLKLLEGENTSLKKQIEALQKSISDKGSNVPAEGNLNQVNDDQEKESLKSQIDFLNSIIVDMKQKNEDLTKQLEIQATCWDESDLNLNDSKKKLAPRLFCDICDMFDLHDTDDCPKQESYIAEEAPRLRPQGVLKLEERPYCNNCEMFGHWTLDCKEPETF